MPRFSLILPVLNEEDIITSVVKDIIIALEKLKIDFEIILVENESTDQTWQVINKLAQRDKRIRVTRTKQGYGSSVIAGIKVAQGEFVGYMPSDGQIDVSILTPLWQEIQKGEYDVVKIIRINRESLIRFIRSKYFNLIAHSLYPIDVVDINGSPRILKREKLKRLELTYQDSFIDTEFAIKAHLLKWKFEEIPTKNLERVGGKSTVRMQTVLEFLRNLWNFRQDKNFLRWKERYIN